MAGLGAGSDRLLFNTLELARALADIGNAGDDFAAVGFHEPRNDAGSIEAAGVGDANAGGLLDVRHGRSLFVLECE